MDGWTDRQTELRWLRRAESSSCFLRVKIYHVADDVMLCCSLLPYASYQFRIAASNDVGTSNFSLPSPAVRTLQAAPDSPPLSIAARTVSPTSILVSWMVSFCIAQFISLIILLLTKPLHLSFWSLLVQSSATVSTFNLCNF